MSSQIDELLIMPINKKKDKEKDYLKSCIHSECIFIMIQILIETVKFEKGKTITLILIHLSDSCWNSCYIWKCMFLLKRWVDIWQEKAA